MNLRLTSALVLVAAVGGLVLAGLGNASRESEAVAAKKRCYFVIKKIHGQKRRVRVCTKPAPKPKPHWDYVALGDSLTNGGGQVAPSETYPSVFAARVKLDTKRSVVVNNLGQNNATSTDLLAALRLATFRQALRNAEIVTVDIGYNDFGGDVIDPYAQHQCGGADNEDCLRQMVTRFRANFDAILATLGTLIDPTKKIVRVIDQYNNAIGNSELEALVGPSFGSTVAKKYTEALNDATCEVAHAHGILCADVYHAFNGPSGLDSLFAQGLLADGDHPSVKGHELIAQVLRGLGYAPLQG